MRLLAFTLSIYLSTAAQAAPWSGRVLHQGKPVNGARVRVFARPQKPLAGCPSPGRPSLFGTCLCPAEREAFTARVVAGLESAPALASATTGPDGAFSFSLEGAGPFAAHAASEDGSLQAVLALTPAPQVVDLGLAPVVVSRVRVEGAASQAVVLGVNTFTGELARFSKEDGVWVSPPLPKGNQYLLVAAPGAVPVAQSMFNGVLTSTRMGGTDGSAQTVALSAPALLRGVVTARGVPAVGAEVVEDPGMCALKTKTNAAGEFTLPSVFNAPSLATLTTRVGTMFASGHGSPERSVTLALEPAARLELTFVDPKGAPVAGVEPWVTGQVGALTPQPPSDAKGRWTLADVGNGAVQLHLKGPFVLLSEPNITLDGVTRVRAVVARGASLTGRVLDAKGAPVDGVDVSAFFSEAMQAKVSEAMKEALRGTGAGTDALGAFRFEGLLPGEYEVVAKSVAFGEGTARAVAPGDVELTLAAPVVLEGVVVDAAGAPVEKARVMFHRQGQPHAGFGVATGPDGRFRYALKGPGTFEVTAARPNGGASSTPQLAELPGDPLRLVVGAEQSLRGTVLDAAGNPRGGVLVQAISTRFPQLAMARGMSRSLDPTQLVASARGFGMYAQATTTQDGAFSIALASDALVFAEAGNAFAQAANVTPQTPVRLVLAARARATGRVLDFAGRPVPAFSVNGRRFDSPEGRFDLPLPPAPGEVSLRIDAASAPYEIRALQAPATPTELSLGDITLGRGFTVRGTVRGADTHQPIVPAPFVDAKSEAVAQFDSGGTRADGSFVFERVPEGPLVLTVSGTGYVRRRISLEVGPGLRDRQIELERPASLELLVLRDGEPAAGVDVKASAPASSGYAVDSRAATTASDGTARLEQLTPGAWTVTLGRQATPVRSVRLVPGQRMKLELKLR